ncbi:hypothetical protein [Moheibacter sp.]|uniref:hypothetical protein n=1 Tax=Moheibacter sp. TaxID=1965316 RepID=UPI003C721422
MKILKYIFLFLSVSIFAQNKSGVNRLLVFSPDENSVKFNEVYTQNFFFGNFGIKPLINAIPIDNKNVKTIRISAETEGRKTPDVMILNYDKEGRLTQLKVSEMLSGKGLTVDYVYKDGLIQEEIFKDSEGSRSNKFHYAEGKMIMENVKGMIDVFQLKGNVLYKETFLNGKMVFKDRIEGKCRITRYQQDDIDKICYSNFKGEFPFSMEEFTTKENTRTNKITLVPETNWKIEKNTNGTYSILNGKTELYRLELDKNSTVKNFEFLGIKSEFKSPITFSFSYTYY